MVLTLSGSRNEAHEQPASGPERPISNAGTKRWTCVRNERELVFLRDERMKAARLTIALVFLLVRLLLTVQACLFC